MAHAATAELEGYKLDLGFGDGHALPRGRYGKGELCQGVVGHEGRAEQCRKGPPHGES
jgi:hypothetical protein